MKKKKEKKRRKRQLTIEDYERSSQSRPSKKFKKDIGLPAQALSNPRLEQCESYFQERKNDDTPITQRVYMAKRGHRPFTKILYVPMGGLKNR